MKKSEQIGIKKKTKTKKNKTIDPMQHAWVNMTVWNQTSDFGDSWLDVLGGDTIDEVNLYYF